MGCFFDGETCLELSVGLSGVLSVSGLCSQEILHLLQ